MEKFLDNFDKKYKGPVVNFFLDPIRQGYTRHSDIMGYVIKDFERKLRYGPLIAYQKWLYDQLKELGWGEGDIYSSSGNDEFVQQLDSFIDYYIEYSKLSREEIQARKEKNGEKFIHEYMSNKPATEKQISYARSLGWVGDEKNFSMFEASQYIDQTITKNDYVYRINQHPLVAKHHKMEIENNINNGDPNPKTKEEWEIHLDLIQRRAKNEERLIEIGYIR